MFVVEQFIDDFTLNVTKEGYMFLTVKQAVEFLKNVDEDKVAEEGYLKSLIEDKRKQIAQRQKTMRAGQNHMTMIKGHASGPSDQSFNIMSNPMNQN